MLRPCRKRVALFATRLLAYFISCLVIDSPGMCQPHQHLPMTQRTMAPPHGELARLDPRKTAHLRSAAADPLTGIGPRGLSAPGRYSPHTLVPLCSASGEVAACVGSVSTDSLLSLPFLRRVCADRSSSPLKLLRGCSCGLTRRCRCHARHARIDHCDSPRAAASCSRGSNSSKRPPFPIQPRPRLRAGRVLRCLRGGQDSTRSGASYRNKGAVPACPALASLTDCPARWPRTRAGRRGGGRHSAATQAVAVYSGAAGALETCPGLVEAGARIVLTRSLVGRRPAGCVSAIRHRGPTTYCANGGGAVAMARLAPEDATVGLATRAVRAGAR